MTLGDVRFGCIGEIKNDDLFWAARGEGAHWIGPNGAEKSPRLLPITEIAKAPLTFEVVARPFEWIGTALSEIVDASSMTGGCFLFNSTAFSLTRLMTGQLAAMMDIGNRLLRDFPASRERFLALGFGKPIGLFAYDIAAAALIAQEAGAIVTDAYGHSLDKTRLLDTTEPNLQSILGASNLALHEKMLAALNTGIGKLTI